MQTVRITTSQNIDIDYEVAGLGERIVARLIDLGIFILLYLAILISGISVSMKNQVFVWLFGIWLFCFAFYDLICEACFNGQSIGKRVMKIKVISLDGARPTFGQYLLRWVFRIVDFSVSLQLGGLISVAITRKNQRIGDIAAGTTLIRTSPRTAINHVAFIPPDANYQSVFPQASQLAESDIVLIHEVLTNYRKSDNHTLIYTAASRVKEHLAIRNTHQMDGLQFLETILKDYNYAISDMSQEAK